jgi:hypothetical protein
MPTLAELHKKYKDQNFHLIGLECQGSSAADIKQLATKNGVEYQITTGGDLKGANVRGIPHGFLFDAEGKLVANNPHGKELEDKIQALLRETWAAAAGPGPYKILAATAEQIKTGKNLGTALKMLRSRKDSKNEAEAAEAKMMFEALNGAAEDRYARAVGKKETAPESAVTELEKITQLFAGDEIGDRARKEAAEMRRDPKVRAELEATAMWKQIEALQGRLQPVRGKSDPKSEEFRRYNAAVLQNILSNCKGLSQRYPGTAAAAKAEELLNQYK